MRNKLKNSDIYQNPAENGIISKKDLPLLVIQGSFLILNTIASISKMYPVQTSGVKKQLKCYGKRIKEFSRDAIVSARILIHLHFRVSKMV